MLISPAYAQAAGSASGSDFLLQMLPLVAIFVVFYFLLIRPQQKRAKQHREMVASVQRGDEVITAGGLKGKVAKVIDDNEILLEIADGVKVTQMRQTISDVLNKTEPRKKDKDADSDKDKDDKK